MARCERPRRTCRSWCVLSAACDAVAWPTAHSSSGEVLAQATGHSLRHIGKGVILPTSVRRADPALGELNLEKRVCGELTIHVVRIGTAMECRILPVFHRTYSMFDPRTSGHECLLAMGDAIQGLYSQSAGLRIPGHSDSPNLRAAIHGVG